jgi:hypothetical protein
VVWRELVLELVLVSELVLIEVLRTESTPWGLG